MKNVQLHRLPLLRKPHRLIFFIEKPHLAPGMQKYQLVLFENEPYVLEALHGDSRERGEQGLGTGDEGNLGSREQNAKF